jgi:two-component system chemotaxis sensor kinase CheA
VTLVTKHGRDAIEDVFIFVIDDMTLDIQDLNAAVAEAVRGR